MRKEIRIGISGWRYAPWRGVFYPKGLPQNQELSYASQELTSIEINGSFYSLQRPGSWQDWYESVPEDFIFSVKANRYITHTRRLNDIEEPLANFFASGLLLLEEKLGPILWQFPPSFSFDAKKIERFFSLLPRDTAAAAKIAEHRSDWMADRSSTFIDRSRPLRHAMEVRHESFCDPKFVELLRRWDIGTVVADTAKKWPYFEDVSSDFIYLRLHGEKQMYVSGYNDAALDRWAQRVRGWLAGRQCPDRVCVAPKLLRPKVNAAYVYFDNDVKVHAPFDAMELIERLTPEKSAQKRRQKRALTI